MRRGERQHSWQEAAVAWADHIRGQVAASTAKRYVVSLKQCEDHLIPLTIEKLDSKAVAALMQARRAAGATPATIRRDLTAISSVIEFAAGMGWVEGNATLQQRRRLRERRDPIVLPTDEGIAAVVAAAGPRFGAFIIGARLTGCRQAELVAAKWSQFNDAAGTLEVVGKGNKRRVIALSPAALAHFRSLPHHAENIFAIDDGRPFSNAPWDFKRFRAKAKRDGATFRPFRFHDLRHLFAVEALRGGMGIYRVSQHLGHTSVELTQKVYLSFLTPEEADRAKAA